MVNKLNVINIVFLITFNEDVMQNLYSGLNNLNRNVV